MFRIHSFFVILLIGVISGCNAKPQTEIQRLQELPKLQSYETEFAVELDCEKNRLGETEYCKFNEFGPIGFKTGMHATEISQYIKKLSTTHNISSLMASKKNGPNGSGWSVRNLWEYDKNIARLKWAERFSLPYKIDQQ